MSPRGCRNARLKTELTALYPVSLPVNLSLFTVPPSWFPPPSTSHPHLNTSRPLIELQRSPVQLFLNKWVTYNPECGGDNLFHCVWRWDDRTLSQCQTPSDPPTDMLPSVLILSHYKQLMSVTAAFLHFLNQCFPRAPSLLPPKWYVTNWKSHWWLNRMKGRISLCTQSS